MEKNANSLDSGKAVQDLLTDTLLARRWGKSCRTLQRMRRAGFGPPWIAIGRSIFYRHSDVLVFEASARKGGGV